MTTSTEELWQHATQGDADALRQAFRQRRREVRKSSEGQIPPRWRSLLSEDDVLQQTYADSFASICRFVYRGGGSFAAWLSQLAKCSLRDVFRMLHAGKRGGNRDRVKDRGVDESYAGLCELLNGNGTTPSRAVARIEVGSALDRPIQKPPKPYRQVVRMYDLEGQSIEKVALGYRLE